MRCPWPCVNLISTETLRRTCILLLFTNRYILRLNLKLSKERGGGFCQNIENSIQNWFASKYHNWQKTEYTVWYTFFVPPDRCSGWGITWKLLLSRLGLFKELFNSSGNNNHKPKPAGNHGSSKREERGVTMSPGSRTRHRKQHHHRERHSPVSSSETWKKVKLSKEQSS